MKEAKNPFTRFEYDTFKEAFKKAMDKGHIIPGGSEEAAIKWYSEFGVDPNKSVKKMKTLPFPKLAIITTGEYEGLYVFSEKVRECYYYELPLERERRLEHERQQRNEESRESIKNAGVIILKIIGFLFLAFILLIIIVGLCNDY